MFVIHIYGLVIFLYVTFRLILPSPLPFWGKFAVVLLALAASQYHLFIRYVFGSLSSPEMPYPMLVLASYSFIVMTLLFAILVGRDLVILVLFFVRQLGLVTAIPFSPGRRAVGLAGLGIVAGAYGFREAVRVPDVRTTDVVLDRLPPELDGLTVVQITDLHATALLNAPRVADVVAKTNALQPDIIVCTGDLVDGTTGNRAADVAPLADLRAAYGVYGCEGNHEYYSGHAAWMRAFEGLGLPLLRNSHAVLTIKGKQLVLAGLNDPAASRFGLEGPDLDKALAGAPEGAPVLLLAHQPRYARFNARRGVDLQLSGHTHGGQMIGFDRIVESNNEGFLRGLYSVGAMKLYVSSGAGLWTGFPVRIGVPAEITRLVLRSGKG
ncbi:Metallophosphoesterase [uncultured delta proteobacterium]|uniref:Metallophosphoesterase n=1 Tax=uncultured delta proteobacterium TaxID=34034 RepID=A0A212ITK9_9DELT|nr:Metallophosphoesterase [uncultured delta proteobacterium]